MRCLRSLTMVAVLVAPSPVLAAAAGMQVEPGLWEIRYSIPDPLGGDPIQQLHRTCVRDRTITSEQVNSRMKECRVSNAVVQGPTAKWKMRCETPAGPMIGTGSLRSNGAAVTGSVEMTMAVGGFEIPMSGAFKGQRVGACR